MVRFRRKSIGHERAPKQRDAVANKMAAEQISQAQALGSGVEAHQKLALNMSTRPPAREARTRRCKSLVLTTINISHS